MSNINKLKSMLFLEVENLEKKVQMLNEKKSNIDLYNSINQMLDDKNVENIIFDLLGLSIALETVLKDEAQIYINKLYDTLYKIRNGNKETNSDEYSISLLEFEKIKNKILEKQLEEEIELEQLKQTEFDKIKEYRQIISFLKYNQYINNYKLINIYKFLESKHMNQKEIIYILESIKKCNVNIQSKFLNNNDLKYKKGIVEMLQMGYEYYKPILIDKAKESKLKSTVKSFLKSWHTCCELGDMNLFDKKELLSYDERIYSPEEYKAFYHIFMNEIQYEISEQIKLIQDKDFYFDKESRKEVLSEYYNLIELYNSARDYFENEITSILNNQKITNYESFNDEKNKSKNHLLFLKRNEENTYFEKDLQNIPCEYLEKVVNLLNDKIKGTLSNIKDKKLNAAADTSRCIKSAFTEQ